MLFKVLVFAGIAYWLYRKFSMAMRPAPAPRPQAVASSAWAVLDLKPGASQKEIHAAYRGKIQQYHPDKVAGMGPEIVATAEAHTRTINQAYAELTGKKPG